MIGGTSGHMRREMEFAFTPPARNDSGTLPASSNVALLDKPHLGRPRPAGFSLIELMVTLSVAAIFAGLAVPAMQQSLQRRPIEGAAREIYGNLLMVRSQAIEKNRNAFISFKGSGTHWAYGLNESTSCDPTVSGNCRFSGADRVYGSDTWHNVSLSQTFSGNSLSFEPRRGTASGSGAIRLVSAAGEIDLSVTPLGYVSACSVGTLHLGGYPPC